MADSTESTNQQQDAGADTAAIESEARGMGWSSEAEFVARGGKKENWRDASTFVNRGREMLPILKAREKRQQEQLIQVTTANNALKAEMAELKSTVQALKEWNSAENLDRAKEQKSQIMTSLKQAKKDGDTDLEVELTDQLSQTNNAIKEAETKPTAKANGAAAGNDQPVVTAPALDPGVAAWIGRTEWWGVDHIRTSMMQGVAMKLRAEGNRQASEAFMDTCAAEVERHLTGGPPVSKTNGSSSSSASGSSTTNNAKGKTYAQLPAEVKETCNRLGAKMTGKGKAFKDEAEWQAAYAKRYWIQEGV